MARKKGRDGQEETTRRDAVAQGDTGTARRAPDTGMPGGRAGVDTESVDFDDMGDLDRGADDATEAEPSTGPGPGYGMAGGAGRVTSDAPELTGYGTNLRASTAGRTSATTTRDDEVDLADVTEVEVDSDELSEELETGPGMATAPALRISDEVTGGMGSDVGDQEGISQGMDIDPEASRSEYPATGTSQRAGLGGRSSGQELFDPASGSNMANPADMGDQG